MSSLHEGSCLSTGLEPWMIMAEVLGGLILIVLVYWGLNQASRRPPPG